MRHWSSRWVEAVNSTVLYRLAGKPPGWGPDIGMHVLEALFSLGAINGPPDRILWCPKCHVAGESIQHLPECDGKGTRKYEEVIE
jgi:hypothetical protein